LSEDLLNSIQQLLLLGKGDAGRLAYILDLIQKGRSLPISDQKYLENIISLYLRPEEPQSIQKHSEFAIDGLHKEIETLNEKISTLERKGFEKYIGRKAIFFFVTVFVGWNALQSYITLATGLIVSNDIIQYLFPLNVLSNYFNAGSLIWFIFILMVLSWPFIGAIHLAGFIRRRKLSNNL
jgi:hypothetical protein